jgi:hypothetical protein
MVDAIPTMQGMDCGPNTALRCNLQRSLGRFKAYIPFADEILKVDARMSFTRKRCTYFSALR